MTPHSASASFHVELEFETTALADFFLLTFPPSTPMSTTSKVKCHGMICELRRSLGPLRHKTYEPLRLKG